MSSKLTQLFQVVSTKDNTKVFKTEVTRGLCERWLDEVADFSDYMGDLTLTIQEIWTNKNAKEVKKLLAK